MDFRGRASVCFHPVIPGDKQRIPDVLQSPTGGNVANCSNCSAPLPPDSIQCDYCGTRNDIDLKGINYFTTHEVESARICPRCRISLRTIDLKTGGRFLIERCDQCLGLFFDPGELEALMEATITNVFVINNSQLNNFSTAKRAAGRGAFYIKCPICAKLMNRINFGTKSGVIVNRCRDHGVWLDGGDLRHLFEWMKAGGKLLDKESHEQAAVEQERERQSTLTQNSSTGNPPDHTGINSYGSTIRDDDPDLFEIVREAIRFFVKL